MADIGPGDKVIGCLTQTADQWVVHNFIGDVEVVGIFNERPDRLAPTGVSPEGNVRFEIWDETICTVRCLRVDRLKEKFERLNETLTCTGICCLKHPLIKTGPVF